MGRLTALDSGVAVAGRFLILLSGQLHDLALAVIAGVLHYLVEEARGNSRRDNVALVRFLHAITSHDVIRSASSSSRLS